MERSLIDCYERNLQTGSMQLGIGILGRRRNPGNTLGLDHPGSAFSYPSVLHWSELLYVRSRVWWVQKQGIFKYSPDSGARESEDCLRARVYLDIKMYLKAFVALLAFGGQACVARNAPYLTPTTNRTTASTSTVFQLDKNNTWFENLVVRPNGSLLATRLDVPDLWSISPGSNNSAGSGRPLYTFPNASSLVGIAQVDIDTYIVVAGNVSLSTFTAAPSSFAIWTIDLTDSDAPVARRITHMPEADFLDGITRFNKDIFLIADTAKGEIWRLNITNRDYSTDISKSVLLPASSASNKIGVNGLKVRKGYVYFTSTTKAIYGRIPVNKDAIQVGPVEIITSGFTLDDFYLAQDGRAYLATNSENRLFEVSPLGEVLLVAGGLNELTVAGLTAVASSQDGKTLYVTTNGGMSSPVSCALVEPAKIVAVRIE